MSRTSALTYDMSQPSESSREVKEGAKVLSEELED